MGELQSMKHWNSITVQSAPYSVFLMLISVISGFNEKLTKHFEQSNE